MATPAFVGTPFGPTSGGKVTAINTLGTSPIQVVGANPQRGGITFANPGSVLAYVAPLTNASGQSLVPSLAALGGCFPVGAGGIITLTGECQGGWQAFSASGSNNPLTVSESNV